MVNPSLSVVHLTMRKGKRELSIGSGVLYRRNAGYYIATAWHNLTGRHSDSLSLLSKMGALPDNVVATVALLLTSASSIGSSRMSFTVPLEITDKTSYFVHPVGWPRIDVAVIPIDPNAAFVSEMRLADGSDVSMETKMRQTSVKGSVATDIQPIQDCAGTFGRIGVVPDELIDPGDDLFVLGYPRGIADYSFEPIWKRATVASDPHGGWNRQPQFLIDCASREGMSGAPVVAFSKTGNVQVGGMKHIGNGPAAVLHGIYVGRLVDPEVTVEDRLFEAQIGTVWKRSVIDEIIDGKVLGLHSSEVVAPGKAVDEAVRVIWPQIEGHFQKVLDHEEYRRGIVHEALQHLKGNADPKAVMDSVMQYARELSVQPKSN